jgi:mitotic-spindle organizing protein 1
MPPGGTSRQRAAKDVVDVLNEISTLLVFFTLPPSLRSVADEIKNTGLDRTTLSLCVSLIENGVNPEALAVSKPLGICDANANAGQTVIKELRREARALEQQPVGR